MAEFAAASPPRVQDAVPRFLHLACFALCVVNVASLVAMYIGGTFLFDELGRPMPADFVNVWAAGSLALEGRAAEAYDWAIHKQVEYAAVGFNFGSYYGWHYPPSFLFAAAVLALVPYIPAYLAWLAVTLPLYLATLRWIAGHPFGWMLAFGVPANFATLAVGQNGFLTASLIGGTLGFMERRPVLSGVCLGLLTYKPQFGLLFPLVLIVARQWTVFWTAALVGAAMAALSWLAFGTEAWRAFFEWLPATSQAILSEGRADWGKLQSAFGVVRELGGGETLAWGAQIAVALLAAGFLCVLWRSAVRFELKAAALAAGCLLATPYVYLYDMVVLGVAAAFLLRFWLATEFRSHELVLLGVAAGLMIAVPFAKAPFGFGATLIAMLLVCLRAYPAAVLRPAG